MTTSYKPNPIIIRTPVDEIGSLVDTDRIQGEDLYNYVRRIYDTYANRASSTYEGLLNAINRDLNLSKEEVIEIDIRYISKVTIDGNVNITLDTIEDNNYYTETINGSTVIAVGSLLKDTTKDWEPGTLRGYKLIINSDEYDITENTETEISIDADLNNLVGQTYEIKPNWSTGELIGLGVRIGGRLYKIIENDSNSIRTDRSIEQKDAGSYTVTVYNPKVEVTASKIFLYKDYKNKENYQLEKVIDLREDVTFHTEIVDIINTLRFFEARDISGSDEVFSKTLKKQSSEKVVINEIIPSTRFFKLKNQSIKEGSVSFSETNTFLNEVEEENVSKSQGNYYIDYDKGVVIVNTIPSGNKPASYIWNDFPYKVIASPVVVNSLSMSDTQEYLFSQEEMKIYNNYEEQFISSQPKADMIEFISELLKVNPQSWGE